MKKEIILSAILASSLLPSCQRAKQDSLEGVQPGMSIEQVQELTTMTLRQAAFDEQGNEHHLFLLTEDQQKSQNKTRKYTYLSFTNGKYEGFRVEPQPL